MDVMHQRAREEDWMPAGRPPSGRRRSLGNRRCILRGEGLCRTESGEHDMDTRRALARTEEAALKDLVAMFKVSTILQDVLFLCFAPSCFELLPVCIDRSLDPCLWSQNRGNLSRISARGTFEYRFYAQKYLIVWFSRNASEVRRESCSTATKRFVTDKPNASWKLNVTSSQRAPVNP
ncbi:unnamed protein product [Ectocarpus sp. 6 AP-2014]